jgi:hypothetical protein
LAAEIGDAALVAVDNRDALQGAAVVVVVVVVVVALRFTVLESVIDEMADSLTDKVVVVPSNPVASTHTATSYVCYRKGNPPARSWPGGCPRACAWRWRSERCRPIFSSPPATAHRSQRSSFT